KPRTKRLEAVGPTTPSEKHADWQATVKAMLPGLVDQHASENKIKTQAAIKELAASLGFPGEQWTQLRDAYLSKKPPRS
ncbi:unnamed protein product, partial [marine sediment metagenome]